VDRELASQLRQHMTFDDLSQWADHEILELFFLMCVPQAA
jgi:hypothetical protein